MAPASSSETRVALVIGNSAYKDSPLANPVNDATDMAKALQMAGFKVILKRNANSREMRQAIRDFGVELRRAQVGLFYFAGHGVQVKGNNYLMPVAAEIQSEADAEDLAIDANYALRIMEDAQVKVSIVILDACRNNPFARSFRSSARGLAQMSAASGSFVAFATAPGSIAADGTGRNGIYTKHLLASLNGADTDIQKVFQRTRAAVVRETAGKQTPWESTSLVGDFYFRGSASAAAAPSVATGMVDPIAIELSFWDSIKSSLNRADFEAYLRQYPEGRFAALARNRVLASSIQGSAADPLGQSSAPTGAAEDQSRLLELEFWNSVKENRNPDELKAYLEQYPNGRFAALARIRIRELEQSRTVTTPTPTSNAPRYLRESGSGSHVNCYSTRYGGRVWTDQSNCD
ncbi:MAG: caspase family protein [Betaproteobacteria bacterium]